MLQAALYYLGTLRSFKLGLKHVQVIYISIRQIAIKREGKYDICD
jgi:hypothetical protein